MSPFSSADSTYDLSIGTVTGFPSFFNGAFDKVIFYDDTLSDAEVDTIYNYRRNKGLIGIGNEVSQWEMDDINPTDIINGYNGTGVNMDATNIIEWE